MKLTITGICGFVGSRVALHLLDHVEGLAISGIDNLSRIGSEMNRNVLTSAGVRVLHGDARMASDFDQLPPADWVIDAAAKPSVQAGVDGQTSLRQLMDHNLIGTLNVLEYCRKSRAGLILLSSSRVYSIPALSSLPMLTAGAAFALDTTRSMPCGASSAGISEQFSTAAPISPYGGTKLASEVIALEYGEACAFPVWIDRCGVLTGAGQFGTSDQGVFSYWLHAHAGRRPLRYIGFEGTGRQVRDAFHPHDLAALIAIQMTRGANPGHRVYNLGGGPANAMSLAQLTAWCDDRFGRHSPSAEPRPRRFDIPWLIMDSGAASQDLGWTPTRSLSSILEEIATHAAANPDWLSRCGAR